MSRNRKSKSGLPGSMLLIKVGLAVGMVVSAGVGYVWLQRQIYELTHTHAEQEKRLQRIKDYNKTMAETLNALSTPTAVEAQIRKLGLNLVIPAPHQVVRVIDPGDPKTLAAAKLALGSGAGGAP